MFLFLLLQLILLTVVRVAQRHWLHDCAQQAVNFNDVLGEQRLFTWKWFEWFNVSCIVRQTNLFLFYIFSAIRVVAEWIFAGASNISCAQFFFITSWCPIPGESIDLKETVSKNEKAKLVRCRIKLQLPWTNPFFYYANLFFSFSFRLTRCHILNAY